MRTSMLVVAATAAVLFSASAQAGHFCDRCGCERNCRKVCKLECGKKKQTKVEYSAECEDFCISGPSEKCCVQVECDCDGHRHRKVTWKPPTWAKMYTRKKLIKKEVSKEVPDYKWVVEEYCCVCGHCIKVDEKAKEGHAGSETARTPIVMNTDESTDDVADEMPADYHKVGFVQVVADDEPSPETADGDLLLSDDGNEQDATPRNSETRRPLLRLFSR